LYNTSVTQMVEQEKVASVRDPRFDRAVLLCAGAQPPARLLRGLDQRAIATVDAANVYDVMVRFAKHQPGLVIIEEPQNHDAAKLDRLTAALQRYYPNVIFWQYRESDGSGLTRYVEPVEQVEPVEPTTKSPTDVLQQKHDAAGKQPFTGPKIEPQAAQPRTDQGSSIDTPLLTQEELNMLLGTDDDLDSTSNRQEPPLP